MRCPVSELAALIDSLSPLGKRYVAEAFVREQIIEGAHLGGGDLSTSVRELPPSTIDSPRIDVALRLALHNIEQQLPVLTARARLCFAVAFGMGLALAAAIVWSMIGSGEKVIKALATLMPAASGGTMFAFYQHTSTQIENLRKDLIQISQALNPRPVPAPTAGATVARP
jgi:hypothetical protein